MMLETFFNKFDELADTPNAVPRMRRFILDLAVRGKLVAQDAKDEPADELLKRVQAEKTHLIKSGEIKKQAQLPPVGDDAIPFALPAGWAASQLGDIAVCLDYMREPINGTERDLRIAGKAESELFPYFGATQQQGWIDDFIFDAELVLLGEDGVPFFDDLRPKAYLITGRTWVNNHAHVFRGILVSNPFVMHWLNTFDYTDRVAGSTRSKLNQAKAVDIPIALPPLAEQKRIVAKVDELMALCDRLEAHQQERGTRHVALARASLARFAEAPIPANLQFLFHPSYTITPADLRKSVLALAVQGKLVSQDPNDEPAEALVERVTALREQFSAGKRVKAAKRLRELDYKKCSHKLPGSWTWCRLGDIVLDFRYGTSRKCARNISGVPVLRIPNIQSGRIDSTDLKFTDMPSAEFKELCLQDGDLLLVRSNGSENLVGRSAVASVNDERFAYAGYLVRAKLPKKEVFAPFLHVALSTPSVRDQIEGPIRTTSGVKNINTTELSNLVFPLPPLAEQRRIVAKVEQLMALVDSLETQLADSRATASNLLSALVADLTGTPNNRNVSASPTPGSGRRGRPRKA